MLSDLSSPVSAFVNEKCTLGPECRVEIDELWKAWERWCEEEGRDKAGTRQGFGRQLSAAIPGLMVRRNHMIGRFYQGLCLAQPELTGTFNAPQPPSA